MNTTLRQLKHALLSILIATIACLPFLPGLPGDFVFDDGFNIVENPWIQLQSLTPSAIIEAAFSPEPGGHTRVLPTLSFALDYFRGGGLDPLTFKTTNLAIHALTSVLLALFLRNILLLSGTNPKRAAWAALAMAAAWAIHPLQVSSVLYIVQRMQTMSTLFLLLALLTYLKARQAQMSGHSGRTGWLATGLLWALALACKEDAALLPAYTLALELTVLRFHAADANLARKLQRGYTLATVLGAAAFFFFIIPHYWSWEAYPGRNFSSYERLISQARVLCMYLWEIIAPLPSRMPFYYDWLLPSRGLLQPWATLPSLFVIAGLLGSAWHLRHRRPLFSFGIFLFFFGHFITSNVIAVELAYEHRNHLPLIGIVLATGDLMAVAASKIRLSGRYATIAVALILVTLGSLTAVRAYSWRSDMSLALTSTTLAPKSARAWNSLCVAYFNAGGGLTHSNPNIRKAANACSKAASLDSNSIAALSNVLTYRTYLGAVTDTDWSLYLNRLNVVPLKTENANSIWVLINNVRRGVPLNEDNLFEAIATASRRRFFGPSEFASIGYFILGHTHQPDRAYPYFLNAVVTTSNPTLARGIIEEMRSQGRITWAEQLQAQYVVRKDH